MRYALQNFSIRMTSCCRGFRQKKRIHTSEVRREDERVLYGKQKTARERTQVTSALGMGSKGKYLTSSFDGYPF